MTEISRYFLEYYSGLCRKNGSPRKDDVEKGIFAFVAAEFTRQPADKAEAARIAKSRLARFELMPLHTFEVFFRSYPDRRKIEALRRKSERLALEKYTDGKLVSREEYKSFSLTFQSALSPLLTDAEYKEYISEVNREFFSNLKYAAGVIETVPERIKYMADYYIQSRR